MSDNSMDLLNGLLNDPKMMENIKNMFSSSPQKEESATASEPEPPVATSAPDMSFLANLLAGDQRTGEVMNKMKQAYDMYQNEDDPSINLLHALSPYLSKKRTANLDRVITMVKIGRVVSAFGKGSGR